MIFSGVAEIGSDYSGRRPTVIEVENARFERCQFDSVRCPTVAFGAGLELTEFIDCSFDGARFNSIDFGFSRFTRCSFRDANLGDISSQYGEFIDCVFTGKIRAAIFWGVRPEKATDSRYHATVRARNRDGRAIPQAYHQLALRPENEFRGNDFSNAELFDVTFRSIDLTQQRLPSGDNYLYLPDAETSINRATQMIGDRPEATEAEDFLQRVLGYEVRNGQRQLFLRQADFDDKGTAKGAILAFELLRATSTQ